MICANTWFDNLILQVAAGKSKECLLVSSAMAWEIPGPDTIRAVIRLAWASCSGNLHLMDLDLLNQRLGDVQPSQDDILGRIYN